MGFPKGTRLLPAIHLLLGLVVMPANPLVMGASADNSIAASQPAHPLANASAVVGGRVTGDIREVSADLVIPPIGEKPPVAGRRIRQTSPGYEHTRVYHMLNLPEDWQPGGRWPVIVEYTGNGGYVDGLGDRCTGRVEDCRLGYGISGGRGFIWVAMPFLNAAGTANVESWWGDPPDYRAEATVEYCRQTVSYICHEYGGDPDRVLLAGFSRGAIACNYIGLHDDSIARLWRGFIAFSHYDGVISRWPFPQAGRREALERLRRLNGRPQFICSETGRPPDTSLEATERYLRSTGEKAPWTFCSTGFRNHSDAWVLRPSPARTALRRWVQDVLAESSTRPAQSQSGSALTP